MRIPILVITSDKWSRTPYVVFADDQIADGLIPKTWIDEMFDKANSHDDDMFIPREQIVKQVTHDFKMENTPVDSFCSRKHTLVAGGYAYKYDPKTGMLKKL